jgi:hypothetical protein
MSYDEWEYEDMRRNFLPEEWLETAASEWRDHQRIVEYLDILTVKRSCLSLISDGPVFEDVALLVDGALVAEPALDNITFDLL